jgi:hypothetical protein
MLSRRNKKMSKRNKNYKKKTYKKRWSTAFGAAENVYNKSGSYEQAREKLKSQAIKNARILFGSVNERL